ncbi:MAG TPA: hypothetical protein PKX92_09435 [Edaphocola sp.]|nr:hypothetical protein [Edaphocola sp.]
MKQIIFCGLLLTASTLSISSFAQQATTTQTQSSNVFYGQDAPWTGDKQIDKKLAVLDNQYKAYEKAAKKNKQTEMTKLKQSIMQWPGQNEVWIKDLSQHQQQMIERWIKFANQNLNII